MTLQEKIAALPPIPTLPRIGIVDGSAHYARLLIALHARNALLCEAIREISKDAAKRPMAHLVGWRALSEAEKVIAACEVPNEPR